MRKKYCIGNWKMNKTLEESSEYFTKLLKKPLILPETQIILCVPFTGLFYINEILNGYEIHLGAQNVYYEENGAFTGEISTKMLRDCGCVWVILGHSERRHIFLEEEDLIRRKVRNVLKSGLSPILCIGETLQERNNNQTQKKLESQLQSSLNNLNNFNSKNIIIAYEPVWAIGTGNNATPEIIENTHQTIRNILKKMNLNSEEISIIYGGSVNSKNSNDIIKIEGVDGFLLGGSSLDVEEFYKIYKDFKSIGE